MGGLEKNRTMAANNLRSLMHPYVLCKTFGHAWEEVNPLDNPYPASVWTFTISIRCIRCLTHRHDGISSRGEVGQRRYVYPGDYRLAEKASRAELRLELRRRVTLMQKKQRQQLKVVS